MSPILYKYIFSALGPRAELYLCMCLRRLFCIFIQIYSLLACSRLFGRYMRRSRLRHVNLLLTSCLFVVSYLLIQWLCSIESSLYTSYLQKKKINNASLSLSSLRYARNRPPVDLFVAYYYIFHFRAILFALYMYISISFFQLPSSIVGNYFN